MHTSVHICSCASGVVYLLDCMHVNTSMFCVSVFISLCHHIHLLCILQTKQCIEKCIKLYKIIKGIMWLWIFVRWQLIVFLFVFCFPRTDDKGDVVSMKFSPDKRILAIQRTPRTVVRGACLFWLVGWLCFVCLKYVVILSALFLFCAWSGGWGGGL